MGLGQRRFVSIYGREMVVPNTYEAEKWLSPKQLQSPKLPVQIKVD